MRFSPGPNSQVLFSDTCLPSIFQFLSYLFPVPQWQERCCYSHFIGRSYECLGEVTPILQMRILRLRKLKYQNLNSGPLAFHYSPTAPRKKLEWCEWEQWEISNCADFCGWFKLFTICITESETSEEDPVGKDSCLGPSWFLSWAITPNVHCELNFSAAA